jgi:hypothetical protein
MWKVILIVAILVFVMLPLTLSRAGIATYKGDDRDFWLSHSLIVCKLTGVPKYDKEKDFYTAEVDVCSVAFTDIPVAQKISLNFYAGLFGAVDEASIPTKGVTILACITKIRGDWWVPTDHIAFMPDTQGILKVNDEADPRLEPLIEAIANIRHKATKVDPKEK